MREETSASLASGAPAAVKLAKIAVIFWLFTRANQNRIASLLDGRCGSHPLKRNEWNASRQKVTRLGLRRWPICGSSSRVAEAENDKVLCRYPENATDACNLSSDFCAPYVISDRPI